jgi:hypothetical protein
MNAADRIDSEGCKWGPADPSPPTYLQAKRGVARPSTPKGVGREAPLTAERRSAKSLGRSAGQGTIEAGRGGGLGRGLIGGLRVHTFLALRCGKRRFPAADHNKSPSRDRCGDVNFSWSAAGKLTFAGDRSQCGRGSVAVAGGGREGTGVGVGGDCETKPGRFGYVLRLAGGWWS